MQQSLPSVLQARSHLQQSAAAAADATYAAQHSREFAAGMRASLPGALHEMEAALRDASWAAAEVARRHREQQGGGSGLSGYLGGLLPQRIVDLWTYGQGGGGGAWRAGGGSGTGGGSDKSSDDGGGMYR